MTAAHCIDSPGIPEKWFVVAGSKYTNAPKSNKYNVKEIKLHPGYAIKSLINDVAILVIKGEFKFSKNIKVMSMANSLELPKGTVGYYIFQISCYVFIYFKGIQGYPYVLALFKINLWPHWTDLLPISNFESILQF